MAKKWMALALAAALSWAMCISCLAQQPSAVPPEEEGGEGADWQQAQVEDLLNQLGLQQLADAIPSSTREYLQQLGISADHPTQLLQLTPSQVGQLAAGLAREGLQGVGQAFFSMVAVAALALVLQQLQNAGLQSALSAAISLVVTLCTALVVSQPVAHCARLVEQAADELSRFMMAFLPVFSASVAAAGLPATATAYHMTLLAACQLIARLAGGLLSPLVGGYLALSLTGACTGNELLLRMAKGVQTAVCWLLGLSMTLFVGFLSLQSFLAAGGDKLGVKTTKFLLGSFVPVIGSAISDAYAAAKGCIALVKTTVGSIGVAVVALCCLPVLIWVGAWQGMFGICAAVGSWLELAGLDKLFRALGGAMAMLMAMAVSMALLFLIGIGVMLVLGTG